MYGPENASGIRFSKIDIDRSIYRIYRIDIEYRHAANQLKYNLRVPKSNPGSVFRFDLTLVRTTPKMFENVHQFWKFKFFETNTVAPFKANFGS